MERAGLARPSSSRKPTPISANAFSTSACPCALRTPRVWQGIDTRERVQHQRLPLRVMHPKGLAGYRHTLTRSAPAPAPARYAPQGFSRVSKQPKGCRSQVVQQDETLNPLSPNPKA